MSNYYKHYHSINANRFLNLFLKFDRFQSKLNTFHFKNFKNFINSFNVIRIKIKRRILLRNVNKSADQKIKTNDRLAEKILITKL